MFRFGLSCQEIATLLTRQLLRRRRRRLRRRRHRLWVMRSSQNKAASLTQCQHECLHAIGQVEERLMF